MRGRTSHKARGSPINKKLCADKLENIRRSFEATSTTSMCQMALEMNMDEKTMRNAVLTALHGLPCPSPPPSSDSEAKRDLSGAIKDSAILFEAPWCHSENLL